MQPRYTSLRDSPAPKKEYVLDYSNLCGGINLWDPDYRLKPNESPEMKNLLWRNGMLCSRKGQIYLNSTMLGLGIAAYPRFWHGHILHIFLTGSTVLILLAGMQFRFVPACL